MDRNRNPWCTTRDFTATLRSLPWQKVDANSTTDSQSQKLRKFHARRKNRAKRAAAGRRHGSDSLPETPALRPSVPRGSPASALRKTHIGSHRIEQMVQLPVSVLPPPVAPLTWRALLTPSHSFSITPRSTTMLSRNSRNARCPASTPVLPKDQTSANMKQLSMCFARIASAFHETCDGAGRMKKIGSGGDKPLHRLSRGVRYGAYSCGGRKWEHGLAPSEVNKDVARSARVCGFVATRRQSLSKAAEEAAYGKRRLLTQGRLHPIPWGPAPPRPPHRPRRWSLCA